MKKIYLLFLSMALVLAVSCSHNTKTTKEPESPTTDDPVTTTNDPVTPTGPTVNELLKNIPATFEEYKKQLDDTSNRSASRSATEAVPLADSDTQPFSTHAYGEIGGGDEIIGTFLMVLKNDISILDGYSYDTNFTIPANFSVSQKTITETEATFGYGAKAFESVTFKTLKVSKNGENVSIFWLLDLARDDTGEITNNPISMLINGVYKNGKYEELTTYVRQDFTATYGFIQDCLSHYYTKDDKKVHTLDLISTDGTNALGREQMISFEDDNNFDYYAFDAEDYKECCYHNAQYYADYMTSNNNSYSIYDADKNLIALKTDSTTSYYIPLSFINTNGKTIKKEVSGVNTTYCIDETETENIVEYVVEIDENNPHLFYKYDGLSTDGFTFTKADIFASATQKLTSMQQTLNSPELKTNFISDTEFNSLKDQCSTWVSSL